MNMESLKKNSKELQDFIKKAKRKLLELEIMQSEWEIRNGKGRMFKSAGALMNYIKSH